MVLIVDSTNNLIAYSGLTKISIVHIQTSTICDRSASPTLLYGSVRNVGIETTPGHQWPQKSSSRAPSSFGSPLIELVSCNYNYGLLLIKATSISPVTQVSTTLDYPLCVVEVTDCGSRRFLLVSYCHLSIIVCLFQRLMNGKRCICRLPSLTVYQTGIF